MQSKTLQFVITFQINLSILLLTMQTNWQSRVSMEIELRERKSRSQAAKQMADAMCRRQWRTSKLHLHYLLIACFSDVDASGPTLVQHTCTHTVLMALTMHTFAMGRDRQR